MKRSTFLLSILLSSLFSSNCFAEKVFDVHDGDTFRLAKTQTACLQSRHKPRPHQAIRMFGIDSPEINQPLGKESRDALKFMIMNKEVELQCSACSFQRQACIVFVDGRNINEEMVKQGWCFDSPKYSHGRYATQQAEAQKAHRGVWIMEDGGQRPWEYRQKMKEKRIGFLHESF